MVGARKHCCLSLRVLIIGGMVKKTTNKVTEQCLALRTRGRELRYTSAVTEVEQFS